jgi:hypothetical protein
MGVLIEHEEQAVRLARAILADLALYNQDSIRDARSLPADLAEEIAEARGLFTSRVTAPLQGLFDAELVAWIARVRPDLGSDVVPASGSSPVAPPQPTLGQPTPPSASPAPRSAEAVYRRAAEREAEVPASTFSNPLVVSLVSAVVVLAGVVMWLASR